MKARSFALILTGLLLGFLVILQSRSFRGVQDIIGRDTRANVFREIQILKETNENLDDEITNLEVQLTKASNRQQALDAVQEEIEKNRILAGHVDTSGEGIEVIVQKDVAVIWLTDLVNELWNAGAEAISINNIRLTNSTVGFDPLPNGQIAVNGSILTAPYTFQSIGNKKTLSDALTQPQGILQRMKDGLGNVEVTVNQNELLKMEKVL